MNARELARQLTRVGALALPIAAVGSALAGVGWAVAADPELATLVRRAPGLLGPIAALLFVAAPIGAVNAAEIGALREGQQLLWLRAAGRSVFAQVIAARVLALALVAPLAAWIAAAALSGGAVLAASRGTAALHSFAALALEDLLPAAAFSVLSGALLAGVGCAIGLASRASVARTAARGAAACLVLGAALSIALLAGGPS